MLPHTPNGPHCPLDVLDDDRIAVFKDAIEQAIAAPTDNQLLWTVADVELEREIGWLAHQPGCASRA